MADDLGIVKSLNASVMTQNDKSGHKAAHSVSNEVSTSSSAVSKLTDKLISEVKKNTNEASIATDNNLEKEIKKQVQHLQDISKVKGWAVSFSVDQEYDKPVIKIVDTDTQKVIKQIPGEDFLAMSKKLAELRSDDVNKSTLSGLLFDKKV
jgi:flagellar protein FlaG